MFGIKTQAQRIADLEQEVKALRSELHQIDVEWSATYEKFRTLMARFAKRKQRDEAQETLAIEPQAPQAHDPVTARVLARRSHDGLPNRVSR